MHGCVLILRLGKPRVKSALVLAGTTLMLLDLWRLEAVLGLEERIFCLGCRGKCDVRALVVPCSQAFMRVLRWQLGFSLLPHRRCDSTLEIASIRRLSILLTPAYSQASKELIHLNISGL